MDDRHNIEDSLKKIFDEFRTEPNENLWSRISSELDDDSENIVADGFENLSGVFENYKVKPSRKVWMGIISILDGGTAGVTGSLLSRIIASRVFRVSLNVLFAVMTLVTISYMPSARNDGYSESAVLKVKKTGNEKIATINNNTKNLTPKPESENTASIIPVPGKSQEPKKEIDFREPVISFKMNQSQRITNSNENNQDIENNNLEIHEKGTISDKNTEKKAENILENKQVRLNLMQKSMNHPLVLSSKPDIKSIDDIPDKSESKSFYGLRDTIYTDWLNKFRYQKTFNWFLGFNFYPKYTTSTVVTSDAVYSDPIEKFKEFETPNPGYKLAVNLGHFTRKQFLFESGLGYELRQTYAQYNLVYTRVDTTITIGYDSFGNIVTDTNINEQKVHMIARSNNQHKIIEVPLLAGYRYPWFKSVLIFKTGPVFGIPVSNKYELNHIDGVYLEEIPYPELNKIHLSWMFTFEYSYHISERSAVMIAPVFRIPVNSVYRDYPIQHNFYAWGLNAGLYYYFRLR